MGAERSMGFPMHLLVLGGAVVDRVASGSIELQVFLIFWDFHLAIQSVENVSCIPAASLQWLARTSS